MTRTRRVRGYLAPRCVGPIGGTTTLADCMVALRYLLSRQELVEGPAIAEYEAEFARIAGARYACSFWAGRVGLYALLVGLGIGRDDEVLLQVPTHVVVANAIRYTGARPVYVDCALESYNIDLAEAERRITPNTRVLLLQHTFGNPVDLDAALELASRHNLVVIEDCVHALGATYRGRPVGSFGRAAFFSTEETKTISSTMGGIVTTDDPGLAARLIAFRNGSRSRLYTDSRAPSMSWVASAIRCLVRRATTSCAASGRRTMSSGSATRRPLSPSDSCGACQATSNAAATWPPHTAHVCRKSGTGCREPPTPPSPPSCATRSGSRTGRTRFVRPARACCWATGSRRCWRRRRHPSTAHTRRARVRGPKPRRSISSTCPPTR